VKAKQLPVYKEAQRLVSLLHEATRKAPRDLRHTLVNRLCIPVMITTESHRRRAMRINQLPPIEYLRECFDYDGETGALYWRSRPLRHFATASKHKRFLTLSAGKEIRTLDGSGYKVVRLTHEGAHRSYRVHRICYAIAHGSDTQKIIDHINGNRQDNRIANLRAVDFSCNVRNQNTPKRKGLRGAHWDKAKRKWLAQMKVNYKTVYIGRFDTEQKAHEAYMAARAQYV